MKIGECHDGNLRFDDTDSHFSLFHAAISVAGLFKMLAGVEARLQIDAALQSEDVFFFFQAEDGIRDHCVTGVQTCALPILIRMHEISDFSIRELRELMAA